MRHEGCWIIPVRACADSGGVVMQYFFLFGKIFYEKPVDQMNFFFSLGRWSITNISSFFSLYIFLLMWFLWSPELKFFRSWQVRYFVWLHIFWYSLGDHGAALWCLYVLTNKLVDGFPHIRSSVQSALSRLNGIVQRPRI